LPLQFGILTAAGDITVSCRAVGTTPVFAVYLYTKGNKTDLVTQATCKLVFRGFWLTKIIKVNYTRYILLS
jgi:hypothetical protein